MEWWELYHCQSSFSHTQSYHSIKVQPCPVLLLSIKVQPLPVLQLSIKVQPRPVLPLSIKVQPHPVHPFVKAEQPCLASLPPSLQPHCCGWFVGAPAVDWTENGRTKEKIPQKMGKPWAWMPPPQQSGSGNPSKRAQVAMLSDLGLTSNSLHGNVSYRQTLTRSVLEISIQVNHIDT